MNGTGSTQNPPPDSQPTEVPGGQPAADATATTPAPAAPAPQPAPAAEQAPPGGPTFPGTPGDWAGGYPSAPQQPAWPVRRLTRSRDDRMLAGVCGGLARYWNTDPVLLRILAVVLTLFTGGALAIGYIIAIIAIPEEPMLMGGPAPFAPGADAGQVGYASGGNPAYGGQGGYVPPARPRERSYLGWLVVSVAILVAGILGLIGFLVPASVQMWGIVGGVTLTILGIGLLIGTRYGRARWLALLAVPLALMTFATVTASNWVQDNPNWDRWTASSSDSNKWGGLSVGDRTWTVTPDDSAGSPLEYRLTAGEATLDLTGLTALGDGGTAAVRQRVEIDAGVGLGQLRVLVPADMELDLTASVDAGQIDVPGSDPVEGENLDLSTTLEPQAGNQPAYIVTLDAAIGAGNLEVLREAA